MNIQIKEFRNLDELNEFLSVETVDGITPIKNIEYVDIKTTGDNYNSEMKYILIYKQY